MDDVIVRCCKCDGMVRKNYIAVETWRGLTEASTSVRWGGVGDENATGAKNAARQMTTSMEETEVRMVKTNAATVTSSSTHEQVGCWRWWFRSTHAPPYTASSAMPVMYANVEQIHGIGQRVDGILGGDDVSRLATVMHSTMATNERVGSCHCSNLSTDARHRLYIRSFSMDSRCERGVRSGCE